MADKETRITAKHCNLMKKIPKLRKAKKDYYVRLAKNKDQECMAVWKKCKSKLLEPEAHEEAMGIFHNWIQLKKERKRLYDIAFEDYIKR